MLRRAEVPIARCFSKGEGAVRVCNSFLIALALLLSRQTAHTPYRSESFLAICPYVSGNVNPDARDTYGLKIRDVV